MTQSHDQSYHPYSIRLTVEERELLEQQSGVKPISAYIRSRLFAANDNEPPKRRRKSQPTLKDRQALARVLCKLGESELSASMNEMARLAHLGALPVDLDTEAAIKAACQDIADMRRLLMNALGVWEG